MYPDAAAHSRYLSALDGVASYKVLGQMRLQGYQMKNIHGVAALTDGA